MSLIDDRFTGVDYRHPDELETSNAGLTQDAGKRARIARADGIVTITVCDGANTFWHVLPALSHV